MLDKIKYTIKDTIIYGMGNVTTKIIGIILIPIYTDPAYLSVKEYGILGILEISSQVLISVLSLSLYSAFARWYWDKNYIDKQKSIFFTILFFLIFITALVILPIHLNAKSISQLLFNSERFALLIDLLVVSACIQIVNRLPANLLRLQNKAGLYSLAQIIKLVITLLFTLYFVVVLDLKIKGILFAQIIGGVSFSLIMIKTIVKNIEFKFSLPILKEMINFSLPLALSSLSGVLLSTVDRYSLNYLSKLEDVGIYSLGYKIANTLKIIVVDSFKLAIVPIIYKTMYDKDNTRFYSKLMTYSTYVILFFVLGLSLFGYEIVKLFTKNTVYWEAHKIIPIISFAIVCGLWKDISITGLNIMKKTRIIGIILTLMAVLNLGLNIILIPHFKIIGAASATLIAHFIFFISILYFSQKKYFIPYEFSKMFIISLIAIVFIVIGQLLTNEPLFIRLIIKSLMLIVFPVLLSVFKFYDKNELEAIKGAWRKWRNPKKIKNNISKIKHN